MLFHKFYTEDFGVLHYVGFLQIGSHKGTNFIVWFIYKLIRELMKCIELHAIYHIQLSIKIATICDNNVSVVQMCMNFVGSVM